MATILVFPLTLRRDVDTQSGPVIVAPFPTSRRIRFVEQFAQQLRSLPTQGARNEAMLNIIGQLYNEQLDCGINDGLVEADLIRFADDVWEAVRGGQRGGAA